MNLLHSWKMLLSKVLFLWTEENEVFYIGGSEVLPPPLEKEEERLCLEVLRLEAEGRHYTVNVRRENADAKVPNAEKLLRTTTEPIATVSLLAGRMPMTPEEARKKLISHNLRLVVYLAKKFENTGINVEDLISIGTIGLIKGINTFNPTKNIKLATYASRCIENEILMYLRRNNKTKMEVSIDEPLNVDWDGNELLLSDILGTDEDVISRDMESEVELCLLRRALDILSDREKEIIYLRYGLDRSDGQEMTQKEVADQLGISQSYISRLEKKIMVRLRREIEKYE